ncbi:MAG: dephospho-CoA kinase [Alphaproteobacteria bacterium]
MSRLAGGGVRLEKPRGLFVLGLTGPMASGKSALSRHLRHRGLRVFDADDEVAELRRNLHDARSSAAIITELVSAGAALGERDSQELASSEERVRHRALRRVALQPEGLVALEAYFHPRVRERAQRFLWRARRQGCRAVVLEIPLLFESGYLEAMDYVISTEASAALLGIRRARLANRREGIETRTDSSDMPSATLQERLLASQWDLSHRRRALAHRQGAIVWTGLSRGETRRRALSQAPSRLRSALRGGSRARPFASQGLDLSPPPAAGSKPCARL